MSYFLRTSTDSVALAEMIPPAGTRGRDSRWTAMSMEP